MKRIILAIVMIVATLSVDAQKSYEGTKFLDGWSVGLSGGVFQPTVGQNLIKDNKYMFGLDVQKQFSPVFGLGLEYMTGINAFNTNKKTNLFWYSKFDSPKTLIDFSNLDVIGYVNLMNAICGYNGRPRFFEVVGRAGFGWSHLYSKVNTKEGEPISKSRDVKDCMNATFGLDLNFHVDRAKSLAVSLKPSLTYILGNPVISDRTNNKLNVNNSYLSLMIGVTYKFKNSNGKHYMTPNTRVYTEAQMNEVNEQLKKERAAKEDLMELVTGQERSLRVLKDENEFLKDFIKKKQENR